jgi:hypothetical protein
VRLHVVDGRWGIRGIGELTRTVTLLVNILKFAVRVVDRI